MPFLTYWFYPNPANAGYASPKAVVLLIVCGLMLAASFAIKRWRAKQENPVTKRLSKSWATAARWFSITGLIMIVSRVETISYVSMRIWWVVWFAALVSYGFLQYRMFKAKHYKPIKTQKNADPRDKYLPKKKKK